MDSASFLAAASSEQMSQQILQQIGSVICLLTSSHGQEFLFFELIFRTAIFLPPTPICSSTTSSQEALALMLAEKVFTASFNTLLGALSNCLLTSFDFFLFSSALVYQYWLVLA